MSDEARDTQSTEIARVRESRYIATVNGRTVWEAGPAMSRVFDLALVIFVAWCAVCFVVGVIVCSQWVWGAR